MGFLNKLFGGSNTNEDERSPGQRAALKNAAYFEKMLQQKDRNIAVDMETRSDLMKQGRAEPYHDWSVSYDYLQKFSVTYSMGKPIEECYDIFIHAADWFANGWEPDSTYADMLDMVALGYLLQIPDDKFNGIVKVVEQADAGSDYPEWKPDAILWFIINGKRGGGNQPEAVIWPSLYQYLLDIIRMNKEDATAAMKKYLDSWYSLHRNDPWYDSHKKDHAYTGYWCWEAGAVSKIMQLDDTAFKDSPYYPYDLVHWNKS
ncbi:protein of unknown function [Chitinophaga jiangningensis]|uniref:PoNi C-terminal domain-containing protein n=1 Tax=Chitinophaga jiangningensis TaxID=1419482 RepID=A0A1M6YH34_9BACT|nr:PoNe immunity protein domain-containing protein [Chitinophaga jiangningensis]SHL17452.1 protein of unknown function [Chitinophaga jiangningensis]